MINIRKIVVLFVFVCGLLPAPALVFADFGSSIFRLQKTSAERGNALAQYSLGTFYEFGMSVEPDLKMAKAWYKKAASKNYRPAMDRLTFHEIKNSSYDREKHGAWFKSISDGVVAADPNALIILGQMYLYGIAVKKDLHKAAAFLAKASSLGHTEVDPLVRKINKFIAPKKILHKKAPAKKTVKVRAKPQKKIVEKKKAQPKQDIKPVEKINRKPLKTEDTKKQEDRQKSIQEKRRRYEAAMRKLYQDQLILQQQQEWSESVEDEE